MIPPAALSLPIERHTLANGLRIVLQVDPSLPLAALNLWYHVGSRHDRPPHTGLAHLFEHMLFQGSQHVDTNGHFQHLQRVGGVANGSTWFDRTNYYETLPSYHLDLALWLESDRMGFLLPALDQAKLDTQRDVVMNERRQTVDNQPYGRAFELLQELLFQPHHPYRWPVIGYMEDLTAATLEDVRGFFRTHYVPNNAVLTLVGDFEAPRALDRIAHFFDEIPRGPEPASAAAAPLALDGESREILPDRVELSRVYLAYPAPPVGSRSWYAADLLAQVLSSGKSSRLYRDLVYDRQLAQDVSAWVLPTELGSMFLVIATARPEVSPQALEAELTGHLERAASERPADSELEAARNRLTTGFYDDLQDLEERADLLSMYTTYFDEPERLGRQLEEYLSLEAAELSDLAASALTPDRRAVLHVVPGEGDP